LDIPFPSDQSALYKKNLKSEGVQVEIEEGAKIRISKNKDETIEIHFNSFDKNLKKRKPDSDVWLSFFEMKLTFCLLLLDFR